MSDVIHVINHWGSRRPPFHLWMEEVKRLLIEIYGYPNFLYDVESWCDLYINSYPLDAVWTVISMNDGDQEEMLRERWIDRPL